jgi:hypothetical protein
MTDTTETAPEPAPERPDITEIQQNLTDPYLMPRSAELTQMLMNDKRSLDEICVCVKDFQRKFIALRNENPELAEKYTAMKWMVEQ